jgi:hypothetical protein
MAKRNKHGLSRHIPEPIRREIRKRSKFGCVVCRCAVYQYEHIDPIFNDAHEHNPDYMCLLCGHCHDKVTRGLLSKPTVKGRYAFVQSSEEVRRPFDEFDLSSRNLSVTLGSCVFRDAMTLIELDGIPVLAIEPPEEGAAFPTLSGYFTDHAGTELLRIERNVWHGPAAAWDVQVKGQEISVLVGSGLLALKMRVDPPSHIAVEVLDMRIGTSHLTLREDLLRVGRSSPKAEYYVGIERMECNGAEIGVQVDTSGLLDSKFSGFSIKGGEGIHLKGTGIRMGVRGGVMLLGGLQIEHATRSKTVIWKFPLVTSLEGTKYVLPPRLE